MDLKELNYYYNKFKFGEDYFHELMKRKVHNILLVSTFYDAYIFEQDGRLSEQIYGEYMQLNLSTAPRITSVPTGAQALDLLETGQFDLIITMMRIGDITPFKLSKRVKAKFPDLPILLLINISNDVGMIDKESEEMKYLDNVFSWNGDSKIFLAMIKYVEDKWNVKNDTEIGNVRVIILVEDSIHFYSMFHPILYSEILKQTQRLISEELNDINKRSRMRGRPKVLLCHTYEEAISLYEQYEDHVIAVISDIRFYYQGKIHPKAGLKLIRHIKKHNADCPILLQSSEIENEEDAVKLGVGFLYKKSKTLLHDLHNFIINNLGFGDFVFRDKNGNEVDRANLLKTFGKKLKSVPEESLVYHHRRNHFSAWLVAHGEFNFAKRVKNIKIEDFKNVSQFRKTLIRIFEEVKKVGTQGKIIHFEKNSLDIDAGIIRLAEGSFGGKGRGIAFLNSLFVAMDLESKYDNVNVKIPRTFIVGTSEYDKFIESNRLNSSQLSNKTDQQIKEKFITCELSKELNKILSDFTKRIKYPIAIRSSGLLEDSQSQPFAGIYETYMLPNNNKNSKIRLVQIQNAIKLVFASVFLEKARKYLESINYTLEEEKMAVIIQECVGEEVDGYYYPSISGVGQSYNFYPPADMKHSDGIAALAVGLGRVVVDGESVMRFCPKYPRIDLMKPADMVANTQKYFYAVDFSYKEQDIITNEDSFIKKIDISNDYLEKHFKQLTSVWDYQNNRFLEGNIASGPRVLTFRNLLYYNKIPLAEILRDLLEIGEVSFGVPVEIEFAVEFKKGRNKHHAEFNLLQVRPLSVNRENIKVKLDTLNRNELLMLTSKGMGNGVFKNIKDIVYIDPDKFDNTQTMQIVDEISQINNHLQRVQREFILIGPGRWGTRDRFLGIPVRWEQINKARIIVEASLKNFSVEASQGSHFFHNLVAMNACYFTVSHTSDIDFIDWDWLKLQPSKQKGKYVFHVILEHPIVVKTDGKTGYATVSKS
ncbi:MAG: hypothetical protein K9N07_05230 [Candidatus Cloacimonetes bacterium]|nr:hypothetical protein [Candidatus Cloacimonadota bacterium]